MRKSVEIEKRKVMKSKNSQCASESSALHSQYIPIEGKGTHCKDSNSLTGGLKYGTL